MDIGYKIIDLVYKIFAAPPLITPNAKNDTLNKLNGAIKLASGSWQNIIINGSATLGTPQSRTNFDGIIVVNGNAKITNASFNELEINGHVQLDNSEIRGNLYLNGNATINNCTITKLISYRPKTKIKVLNSTIRIKEEKK